MVTAVAQQQPQRVKNPFDAMLQNFGKLQKDVQAKMDSVFKPQPVYTAAPLSTKKAKKERPARFVSKTGMDNVAKKAARAHTGVLNELQASNSLKMPPMKIMAPTLAGASIIALGLFVANRRRKANRTQKLDMKSAKKGNLKRKDLDSAHTTPYATPTKEELARMKKNNNSASDAAAKLSGVKEETPAKKKVQFRAAANAVATSNRMAADAKAGMLTVEVRECVLSDDDAAKFKGGLIKVDLVLPLNTQHKRTARVNAVGNKLVFDEPLEFFVPVSHEFGELQLKLVSDSGNGVLASRTTVAKCGIFLKAVMYHCPFNHTFQLFKRDKAASGSQLTVHATFKAQHEDRAQAILDTVAREEAELAARKAQQ